MKKNLLNISPFLVTLLLPFTFGVYRVLEIFLHRKHTINSVTDVLYPSIFMFFVDTFFFFFWNIPFFIAYFTFEYLKKDQRFVVRNIVFIFLNLSVFLLFFIDSQTLAVQNQVFKLELLTAFNFRIITHGFVMLKEYYWFIFLILPPFYLIIRVFPIILKKQIISAKLFIAFIGLFITSFISYKPTVWSFHPLIRYHARILTSELPYNGLAYRTFDFYQKKTNNPLLQCPATFFSNKSLSEILNNQRISTVNKGVKKQDNIIVIVIESFNHKYINPQYMPFVYRLIQKSFYNQHHIGSYIRSTQYNTLSILSSQMDKKLQSPSHSLISSFKKENYETLFFFGGEEHTYNFHELTKKYGIERYTSKADYLSQVNTKSHIDNTGDIFDQNFLMYSAQALNKLNQPYLAFILTNQPHYPFGCPGVDSSASQKERYLYCLNYIDKSLELFFNELRDKRTLFVITGDHPFSIDTPPATYFERHRIPLIFYSPYEDLSSYKSDLTTHAGILPSIIDFLNWDYPMPVFNNSIFDSNKNKIFEHLSHTYINSYFVAEDNYVTEYSCLAKEVNVYHRNEFRLSGHNKPIKNNEIKERHTQELKAYIQYTHQFSQTPN